MMKATGHAPVPVPVHIPVPWLVLKKILMKVIARLSFD
jgi:hypothetical protein